MAVFYFDASALVKHYVPEAGSVWVSAQIQLRNENDWEHTIATSQLSQVEVVSAIARRRRMNQINQAQLAQAVALFARYRARRYTLIALNDLTLELATALILRHPLRAYDAVQLATSLQFNQRLEAAGLSSLTFVSADNQLNAAAITEGLLAVNPNIYDQERQR